MTIFSRRGSTPLIDEHLTYFTVTEADDFRRIVATSFATVGRDVAVYPDHVEDSGGTTFGLWNIGALCAGAEPTEWPSLIDEHVQLVTTPPQDLADLSQEDLEDGLFLHLVQSGSLRNPDDLAYARVVAPGLLEVLAVDLPDSVATPSRAEVAERGMLGGMIDLARTNLQGLLASGTLDAEVVDTGAAYTAVTGDSLFTASLALVLQDVIEHVSGETFEGHGTLVAVPFRKQLLYRPVDAPDAALALRSMLKEAFDGYRRQPGPLSPNVYWVRGNRWSQITSFESGKPRVVLDRGLRETLKRL
jgi:hypothetical protein